MSLYDAFYGFLRRRCRLDIYDAEFVYHFLLLTPEVYRSLADGVRAHLGVNGFREHLVELRSTDYIVNWSFRALIEQARPVAGHLGWTLNSHAAAIEQWQTSWQEEHGSIRRPAEVDDEGRERLRQSLAARWMCKRGAF